MPENKDKLTAVLTYHVVPGRSTAAGPRQQVDQMGGKAMLKTVQGEAADHSSAAAARISP